MLGDAGVPTPTATTLAEHDVCRGLGPEAIALLATLVEERSFVTNDVIVRQGDPADEIYLLVGGTVSVTMDLPTGERRRLSTVAPGMVFGELTIVDRSPRTADVRADCAVTCLVLTTRVLDALQETHPGITIAIMRNLLRNVHRTVTRLSREVTTLSG